MNEYGYERSITCDKAYARKLLILRSVILHSDRFR